MSESPAGWYPLPDDPHTMRYWDGEVWTDHTHTFDQPVGLGSTSELISEAFTAVKEQIIPILVLSAVLLIVPNFFSSYFTERALDGFTMNTMDGELQFSGIERSDGITLFAFSLLPYLLATIHTLAITWLMLRTQHSWGGEGDGERQSWGKALGPAVKATPRVFGVLLLVFIGYSFAAALAISLAAILHAVTLLLTLPAATVGLIWLFVKVAPVQVAAFAAPSRPLLATSGSISTGRFMPVLGRIILLALVGLAISMAVGVLGSVLTIATGGGPEISFDDETFSVVGTSGSATLVVRSILSAMSAGVSGAILASGLITIYRNAGGPFDRESGESYR